MIYTGKKEFFTAVVALLLIAAVTSCSLGTESVESWTSSTVKNVVSEAIDREMEYVKPNLDPDLQAKIDGDAKGRPKTGREIVDLTYKENGGDYIDFCYTVNCNGITDTDAVLESARPLVPEESYRELQAEVKRIEKGLMEAGEQYAKAIPESQQQEFYNDLKALIVRTVVLVAAGLVYMCIPDVIIWGKVSAAAAIAIGAGFVANIILTIYGKYRFGVEKEDSQRSVKEWAEQLWKEPKADFALTAAAASMATLIGEGPVVKGITIIVFAATNALTTYREMMKKYDTNL